MTPLSVKQLLAANQIDDMYQVDGCEISIVKLVGIVEGVQEHSTNVTFRINDGSGIIECKHWIEKESSAYSNTGKIRYT